MVKAGFVAFSYFLLLGCVLLPLPVISKAEFLPPSYLTAQSDQNGKVPLFWFSPRPETLEIRYHADGMLMGIYPSLSWHENCVAVKMNPSTLPFYLVKSKVYISHNGIPGETDYDYHAPFLVTVNQDSGGVPRQVFLDSVFASAMGADSSADGEWVGIEHNILMVDSSFWIVFHWNESFPQSPRVGVDSFTNAGNSFCGSRAFFHFNWYPAEYNFMIGAEIITNSKMDSGANRFRIYRSTDSTALIDSANLIASVPVSHFQFTDLGVTAEQTYFYQATSYVSSLESPGSNIAEVIPKKGASLVNDRKRYFVFLNSEEQFSDQLSLTNAGGLPLWFNLRLSLEEPGWTGGSDRYGYTWSDNNLQPETNFAWVDIESTGVKLGSFGDDNENYGFFGLGFPFPFYGRTFDSIRITSDGWLSFSDVIPCSTDTFKWWVNQHLSWLWGPYLLLAPFWDDLKLTDSSFVYFYSGSDSAIISFLNLYHYGQAGRGPYTFQTILTSDGGITFQYREIDDSLYSATVGIQNQYGTTGLEVSYNRNYLRDSLVVNIIPGWVKIDSMEGCIQPGENKTLDLKFDPLLYPKGVYRADLLIDSWDKNHQLEPLVIPLTLCIDTTIDTMTSGVAEDYERPEKITLFQNYPNPFNPTTILRYTVRSPSSVVHSPIHTTIKIYNILGQKMRTLVNEPKSAGDYEVVWDGKDDEGKYVASGIYFCKLTTGSYQKTKKMVLLK